MSAGVISRNVVGIVSVLAFALSSVAASAYDHSVQEVRIDERGYLDSFDDGVVAPLVPVGNVSEAGGVLRLTTPGVISSAGEEVSAVFDNTSFLYNGAGDATFTTLWDPDEPIVDTFFGVVLDEDFSGTGRGVGLAVANAPGGGLGVYLTEVQGGNLLSLNRVGITSGVATSFLLSLFFDDSEDLMTGSFSLDGGSTNTVIGSVPWTSTTAVLSISAGEGVPTIPEPSTALLIGFGLAVIAGGRGRA